MQVGTTAIEISVNKGHTADFSFFQLDNLMGMLIVKPLKFIEMQG